MNPCMGEVPCLWCICFLRVFLGKSGGAPQNVVQFGRREESVHLDAPSHAELSEGRVLGVLCCSQQTLWLFEWFFLWSPLPPPHPAPRLRKHTSLPCRKLKIEACLGFCHSWFHGDVRSDTGSEVTDSFYLVRWCPSLRLWPRLSQHPEGRPGRSCLLGWVLGRWQQCLPISLTRRTGDSHLRRFMEVCFQP